MSEELLLPSPALQRDYFDALQESQYWPVETMLAHQRQRLALLLRHAIANTPFYDRRLRALFRPDGEIDWDRWPDVPTVRRVDMVDQRAAMQALQLPPGAGKTDVVHTSGSTALPITVTLNALGVLANNSLIWRGQARNGLNWSGNLCSRQMVDASTGVWPDGTQLGRWGPGWSRQATGTAWGLYKGTPSDQTFEFITRRNCIYLNAGAKTAHALALEAERLDAQVSLDAMLAQGENCDDADREACRRVFGARIRSEERRVGKEC